MLGQTKSWSWGVVVGGALTAGVFLAVPAFAVAFMGVDIFTQHALGDAFGSPAVDHTNGITTSRESYEGKASLADQAPVVLDNWQYTSTKNVKRTRETRRPQDTRETKKPRNTKDTRRTKRTDNKSTKAHTRN